jgi:hypothetical protein
MSNLSVAIAIARSPALTMRQSFSTPGMDWPCNNRKLPRLDRRCGKRAIVRSTPEYFSGQRVIITGLASAAGRICSAISTT